MDLHKQNFVCWPSVDPQDIKQTYIHTLLDPRRVNGPKSGDRNLEQRTKTFENRTQTLILPGPAFCAFRYHICLWKGTAHLKADLLPHR